MKKICFMFLTRNNLIRPDIWSHFFRNVDPLKYSVVCHPKYKDQVVDPFLLPNIADKIVETDWGDYSLVTAELIMMEIGLRDPNNHIFILLSEKCAPLWSFETIYKHLITYAYSYIGIQQQQHNRYKKFLVKEDVINNYVQHSQWIILNRLHAQYYIDNQARHQQIYQNIPIPDEHYFGSIAMQEQLTDVVFHSKTYANIQQKHALTFKKLDKAIINRLRRDKYLFVRKVDNNSYINLSYLIETPLSDIMKQILAKPIS